MKKMGVFVASFFLLFSTSCPMGNTSSWPVGYNVVTQEPYDMSGSINGGVQYTDGTYFYLCGDGTIGSDLYIFKYDHSGTLVWKKSMALLASGAGKTTQVGRMNSIAGIGDRLYITADTGGISGDKTELFCLNKNDGSFIYKTDLAQGDAYPINSRAVLWGDFILLPVGDMEKVNDEQQMLFYVFAKDCVDGVPLITRHYTNVPSYIGDLPIYNDQLFLLHKKSWRVFDLPKLVNPVYTDSECINRTLEDPSTFYSPYGQNIYIYNDLYINCEAIDSGVDKGSWLVARHCADDSVEWRVKFEGGIFENYGLGLNTMMVPYGNKIILPSYYGRVACVNMDTGEIEWSNIAFPADEVSSNLWAHGVVVNNKWYVQPSYSLGMVYVFDINTGKTMLSFEMSHYFTAVFENCWTDVDGLFYFLALDGFTVLKFFEK